MLLKILQTGEPVLRRRADALSPSAVVSKEIQQLIEWMRETMHDAPGVGLAAPQIGQPLRLAVIEDRPESMAHVAPDKLKAMERRPVPFQIVINPRLRILDGAQQTFFEGCLSASGLTALVPRALSVAVDCLNHNAEAVTITARGWHARILQHEIDHLNGTLYVDRMQPRTLMTVDNYIRYWQEPTVDEVKERLCATSTPSDQHACDPLRDS